MGMLKVFGKGIREEEVAMKRMTQTAILSVMTGCMLLSGAARAEVGQASDEKGELIVTNLIPSSASEEYVLMVDTVQHVLTLYKMTQVGSNKMVTLLATRSYAWDLHLDEFPPVDNKGKPRRWEEKLQNPLFIKQIAQRQADNKAKAAKQEPKALEMPKSSAGKTMMLTQGTAVGTNPQHNFWIIDNSSDGKKILAYQYDGRTNTIQLISARRFDEDLKLANSDKLSYGELISRQLGGKYFPLAEIKKVAEQVQPEKVEEFKE
jgi:hypothetical protein